MSDKTFLIKMDDTKFCDIREHGECVGKFYCQKIPYRYCIGNLKDRPEWCPLKELREAKSWDIDNKFVWVEK
jgi:hypothetical protein